MNSMEDKVIIGYRFVVEQDNGDYNEWWRNKHIESPIYPTEQMAKDALSLVKEKKQKEAIDRVDEWYKYQLPIEKEHGRNINKFNEAYKRCKVDRKREIIKLFINSRIEPVYMYSVPTDTVNEFNIGD